MSGVHRLHGAALEGVQSLLARLYGVDDTQELAPFLLDEGTLSELAGSGAIEPRPGAREQVYVLDDGYEVSVALYLDERARQAAGECMRAEGLVLTAEGFTDFCVALEGVSHFLLMSHRAGHGRPVTELELELQAEVDKYVVGRISPWMSSAELTAPGEEPRVTASDADALGSPDPLALEQKLFVGYALADHLLDEQAERYVMASKLAHRYCRKLERRYLQQMRADELTRNLRSFYRKGQAERLHHIDGL